MFFLYLYDTNKKQSYLYKINIKKNIKIFIRRETDLF